VPIEEEEEEEEVEEEEEEEEALDGCEWSSCPCCINTVTNSLTH
jgi:hypothetical protein